MYMPEILSPAGDLEKLKIAFAYGADAVYLGGEKFGLRTRAVNFGPHEIKQALNFAHKLDKKAYITINTFPHEKEMDELAEYIDFLYKLKERPDALIMSDLGAINLALEITKGEISIHLSTQANVQSVYSAHFWYDMGVKRIILARESSLKIVEKIKSQIPLEIEMFIHGSWCSAYSGHCTISNFTAGRDSNRGGCAHSCRFHYQSHGTFLSSKDLMALKMLPQFLNSGVDSLKIEGRMKTSLYLAYTTNIYKKALNHKLSNDELENMANELEQLSPRGTTDSPWSSDINNNSVDEEKDKSKALFIGIINEVINNTYCLVEVKGKFSSQSKIKCITPGDKSFIFQPRYILDLDDERVEYTKPSTLVKIPYISPMSKWSLLQEIRN